MFETSQEESGAGAAKIVGGVIAVVVVLLVIVYFVFLRGQPNAATGGTAATAAKAAVSGEKPDALRDLRIIGEPNLHRDPATQTMAVWDFRVENRSRSIGYKNIQYATNYLDAQGGSIRQSSGTLSDQVDPTDQHTFSVNDGLYPVGTTRYTIELKGAQPAQ